VFDWTSSGSIIQKAAANKGDRQRKEKGLMPCRFNSYYLPVPDDRFDVDDDAEFDSILSLALSSAPNGVIDYRSPRPKHEFLGYLATCRSLLLHGSNAPDIDVVEPWSDATDGWSSQKAVYAASDGVMPIFFAVANRGKPGLVRDIHRVRVTTDDGRARHFYHVLLTPTPAATPPCSRGMVYVLPRGPFRPYRDREGRSSSEWVSQQPVRPLARIPVSPADFPYLVKGWF